MSIPFVPGDYNAGAADGSDTVITYGAISDRRHVIAGVRWSYSAAPTGGGLTIQMGSTPDTVYQLDITAAGPGEVSFDPPRSAPANAQVIVTLEGGGGTVRGRLHVDHSIE